MNFFYQDNIYWTILIVGETTVLRLRTTPEIKIKTEEFQRHSPDVQKMIWRLKNSTPMYSHVHEFSDFDRICSVIELSSHPEILSQFKRLWAELI
jgi:hypothetical protein